MIKKLFTSILLLGVALTSWGTIYPTPTAPDATGKLSLKYVDDGKGFVCTDETTTLSDVQSAFAGKVTDLTLEGDYTNADWANTMDAFVAACASETINLDLSGCTSLVSKVNTSADFLSKDYSYYYSNETNPVNVTKITAWVNTDGSVAEGKTIFQDENGSFWTDWGGNEGFEHGNKKHYVTQQEIWKDQSGKVYAASEVTVTGENTGTVDVPVTGTAFAFDKCKNVLTGITFPNSDNFKAIPDRLCSPEICPNLANVSFDNTQIEWIGQYAFGSYGQNAQDQKQSLIGNVTFPTTLKVIGADAFKNCTQFTTVDLSRLTNLVKIDYAAFNMGDDSWNKLTTVFLPEGSNLRFFGNQVFSSSHVETLDFSKCTGIKYFAYGGQNEFGEGVKTDGVNSYSTFYWHNYLKTLILPPTLEFIGGGADQNTVVTRGCSQLEDIVFTGTADNNDLTIGAYAFGYMSSLKNVTFSPNLLRIETYSFYQDKQIETVELSGCHRLNFIEEKAFAECSVDEDGDGKHEKGILTVRLCSHPKVIDAPGGHGTGAFNSTKSIRTVEVVACDNTYADECICVQGAFDFDVTNVQTQIDNVDVAARLIYPRELPVRTAETGYTSAFDFFFGDYKMDNDGGSAIITQDNLQAFYKSVPCEGETGLAYLAKEQPGYTSPVGGARYHGNGWLEFINTGDAEMIPEGEFLRTYSRSVDTGVTLLPPGITAYRALDYKSELSDYVQTSSGGYVNINEKNGGEPDYQLYSKMSAEDKTKYKKYKRYALLTVKGKVLLKALRPIHQYMDKTTGEVITEEDLTRSYVPENTGVVLYSTTMNEDNALLIFGNNYTEVDYLFPEYDHTEGRYEEQRLDAIQKGNTEIDQTDNINMLKGSYDQECLVAPVLPWDWDNNMFFAGNKQYRNFGFSKAANGGNGGWVRLQPGQLRLNRAFAMIPAGRFNNFNENESQMPEFYLEDRVATTSGVNTICVLGFSFDEDVVDGIQTISTAAQTYEKDAWYTLQGVKVANPTKGVYIHNNKKVVIK